MRTGRPAGGLAQQPERVLFEQRTQVDAAQCQVVNQVAGTLAVFRQHLVEFSLERFLSFEHGLSQCPQLLDELEADVKVLRVAPLWMALRQWRLQRGLVYAWRSYRRLS